MKGQLFRLVVLALTLTTMFIADAEAVVGRPLTPVSYAGVARRTTRRAAYAGAYAAPVAVAPVTALPGGCAKVISGGTVVYTCSGGVRYAPTYSGATVVYRRI